MLNKVTLGGRLTKDPELRYTPNGVAVTNFTLAVDRNFKDANGEKGCDFIPHVLYRQLAELVANSLAKGSLVNTSGRLQVRTYNNKDNQKVWVTEVVADEVIFMEPKGTHSGGQQQQSDQQNQGGGHNNWGSEVNLDDDIPF